MRASSGRPDGFTLIEVVVALALSGIVLLGARMLLSELADGERRIAESTAVVEAKANGERLLRALLGRVDPGAFEQLRFGVTGLDRGGPNFATYVMSYHIFKTAITNQYEGLGSANAAIFFCIMVAIGYVQYRFLKVRHEY